MEYRGYLQQLADYIKKNLAKGYTTDSLKTALMGQGYSRIQIDKAIQLANQQLANAAPKMVEKPVIKVEVEPIIEEKKNFWEKIKNFLLQKKQKTDEDVVDMSKYKELI